MSVPVSLQESDYMANINSVLHEGYAKVKGVLPNCVSSGSRITGGLGERCPPEDCREEHLLRKCAATPEFRRDGVVNRTGLGLRTNCIRIGRLGPIARIPRLHCPLS